MTDFKKPPIMDTLMHGAKGGTEAPKTPRIQYAEIVKKRAEAAAAAVSTPPYGVPGDPDAFLAFLKAGVFTPEQSRYLLQALPFYREPVMATQDPKGLEILAVWEEVAKTLPPLTGNPFGK